MNWNILVTSGKEIKRDSMISVNESRPAYIDRIYINIIFLLYYYNNTNINVYSNKLT